MAEAHGGRILLVTGGPPEELARIQGLLVEAGLEVLPTPPEQLCRRLATPGADLVVAFWDADWLPRLGFAPWRLEEPQPVPLVVLGRRDDTASQAVAMASGAWDWIAREPEPCADSSAEAGELLLGRVMRCIRLGRRLRDMAMTIDRLTVLSLTDDVTGLHNLRYLRERLPAELERARRYGLSVSVVVLDIDYFKRVNDTADHLLGTLVLQEIGALLRRNLRTHDVVCRYGGDEFVLILGQADAAQALWVAERLRRMLHDQEFRIGDRRLKVTASFGVASYPTHAAENSDDLFRLADRAMYAAKQSGRNRTVVAEAAVVAPAAD